MVVKTRKAVYIPYELWQRLDDEAKPRYDSVTTVLKNIILRYYEPDNKGEPFHKLPLVKEGNEIEEKDDDF
jgi:hypothetical protein